MRTKPLWVRPADGDLFIPKTIEKWGVSYKTNGKEKFISEMGLFDSRVCLGGKIYKIFRGESSAGGMI
jgi:hypothetical protein